MIQPRTGPGRVLLPIVEQHAEEAAFLWLLRDRAVDAPHYAPRHLARLEERVEAHLDGLRVAGEVGLEIATAQLDRHRETGELFAASALALESGDAGRLAPLLEVARAVPEARRGLFGAIGWVGPTVLKPWARGWVDSADPLERLLGVVACSLHRIDLGTRLAGFLDDPDPTVRTRAYRLAGELGRADLCQRVAAAAAREEGVARDWAAWSAGLLGDPLALRELEAVAEGDGPVAGPALEVVARRSAPERVMAWVRALNGERGRPRLVARALGALGDPAAVPWLIARMSDQALARAAAESFALITGANLADDKLDRSPPESFEAVPNDDPADAVVARDPDDDLPWPEPERVGRWWAENGGRFAPGTRHLLGHPAADEEACEAARRHGYQRQRRAASFELAALRPGTPLGTWRERVGVRQEG